MNPVEGFAKRIEGEESMPVSFLVEEVTSAFPLLSSVLLAFVLFRCLFVMVGRPLTVERSVMIMLPVL